MIRSSHIKTFIISFCFLGISFYAFTSSLPRVIITTDINNVGGDPDDKQSLAHLFVYANEVDIKAIIPDYWKGKGFEATLQTIDVYEKDYRNNSYRFKNGNYPHPDSIRNLVANNNDDAINRIILEALKNDERPLYVLVWGSMSVVKQALFKAPEICDNVRVLTIGTHVMAENPHRPNDDANDPTCKKSNWNGRGRNEIFNDSRFNNLWWIENDWAYNGMFEGQQPRDLLQEIKTFGNLGYYIWEVVQTHSWAHYFRAGDTPSLLYLLEAIDHNQPSQSTWGGKFIRPFPNEKPNYWTDDAGTDDWDYANPCSSWNIANTVFNNRINTLLDNREEMYDAFRKKLKALYNK
ncbi:DUF1593 domain-containing protein [Bacteroidales bacterium]|nr:DUF1593 domain-containing protein [Bacteroidales bacterium]